MARNPNDAARSSRVVSLSPVADSRFKNPMLDATARGASRRWASEREVSEYMAVSVRTLQGWRLRGQGPSWRRLGACVRYDLAAVEAWALAQPGGGEVTT
jgi:hypothetical protein